MVWFNGTINDAVDKAKASNSLLLVFIKGEDDLSIAYEKLLNETKFKPEQCIALKISHNSVAHQQFKKIYVTVPVPSVFFLGSSGIPLRVACSKKTSDLQIALNEVLNKQFKENCDNSHELQVNQNAQTKNKSEVSVSEARIQFRLPSNEVCTLEFSNTCTLSEVKLHLTENLKLGSGFKLLRTYPRIAFTPQDDDKTLTDLSLIPNATLIVVPSEGETQLRKIIKKSFVPVFVTAIFQYIFTFFSYFTKFITGTPDQKKQGSRKKDLNVSANKRKHCNSSASNIHGFKFDETDSDSEMNTDNGNSTQQK